MGNSPRKYHWSKAEEEYSFDSKRSKISVTYVPDENIDMIVEVEKSSPLILENRRKRAKYCKSNEKTEEVAKMESSYASKLQKISNILLDVPDENLGMMLEMVRVNEENRRKRKMDLPDELWHKIFGYLPTQYVLRHLALVCSRFGKLCSDGYWMKSIELKSIFRGSQCHQQVLRVLSKATCLRVLKMANIDQRSDFDQIVTTVLCTSKTLKKLDISIKYNSYLQKYTFSTNLAREIFQLGQSIEHLVVSGAAMSKESFQNIVQMKKLKSISLSSRYSREHPIQIEHLICLTKDFLHLERLVITSKIEKLNSISENELRSIFKSFIQMNAMQLKCFDIHLWNYIGSWYDDAGYSSYPVNYENIDSCEVLEHLGISRLHLLSDLELASISRLPKLKYLKMSNGSDFPARKLKKFFETFDISEIIKLDLSHANVTQIVLKAIMKRNGFPKLKYLWLDGCNKIGKELNLLKQFVKTCPKLEFLSLKHVWDTVKLEDLQELEAEGKFKIEIQHWLSLWQPNHEELKQRYTQIVHDTSLGSDCLH